MVAVEQELEDEDAERDAGDLEEAPEVDPQAAAHEEDAEGDRDREADRARRAPPSGRSVVSDSAERKSTVSIPSRKTIRKVKRKSPAATDPARSRVRMRESDPFISPDSACEWRHIQTIIEPTISAEPR